MPSTSLGKTKDFQYWINLLYKYEFSVFPVAGRGVVEGNVVLNLLPTRQEDCLVIGK